MFHNDCGNKWNFFLLVKIYIRASSYQKITCQSLHLEYLSGKVSVIPYRMKFYAVFDLATWLTLIKLTELNISKF